MRQQKLAPGRESVSGCPATSCLPPVFFLPKNGDIVFHPFSRPAMPAIALAASSELIRQTAAAPLDALLRGAVTQVSNSTAATLAPDSTDQGSSPASYAFFAMAGLACLIFAGKALDAYQRRNGVDTTDFFYNLSPFDSGGDFGMTGSGNLSEQSVRRASLPPTYDEASAGLPTYEEAAPASPAASSMPAHEIVLTPALFLSGTSSGASDA